MNIFYFRVNGIFSNFGALCKEKAPIMFVIDTKFIENKISDNFYFEKNPVNLIVKKFFFGLRKINGKIH